jgi:hypothetical protein
MATKIFISWSGDLSNKLAEALRHWLPGVLQFVKPYFTPSDIEKGARWGSDILSELDSSDIGIICLTKENLNKPWILFESGALSKNFEKSRVCTVLFGVEATDLTGPLTIFQNTRFNKEDFKKLVKTINNAAGETKLEDSVLHGVFEMWWPRLEDEVNSILTDQENLHEGNHRTERDMLEEILELTRLTTRRSRREIHYSPEIMLELIENIAEMSAALEHGDFKRAVMLCARLDRPISYICKYSDFPELYERYTMKRRGRRRPIEDIESTEEN